MRSKLSCSFIILWLIKQIKLTIFGENIRSLLSRLLRVLSAALFASTVRRLILCRQTLQKRTALRILAALFASQPALGDRPHDSRQYVAYAAFPDQIWRLKTALNMQRTRFQMTTYFLSRS